MTGRPINEDRRTAIELGFKTYIGATHPKCGTNVRYVKGGGCVHCGRVIATEQREARAYLKKLQAEGAAPLDISPEPEVEVDTDIDTRRDEGDTDPYQESIEDLM